MATRKNEHYEWAMETLRRDLAPGDTVYTILRHVSPSGMTRWIETVVPGDEIGNITGLVSIATDTSRAGKHPGMKVEGCGMDMGFHIVYGLGRVLWPDGFDCVGEGCPSNDHSNGDRDYTPHRHTDGGYALRHRWL